MIDNDEFDAWENDERNRRRAAAAEREEDIFERNLKFINDGHPERRDPYDDED